MPSASPTGFRPGPRQGRGVAESTREGRAISDRVGVCSAEERNDPENSFWLEGCAPLPPVFCQRVRYCLKTEELKVLSGKKSVEVLENKGHAGLEEGESRSTKRGFWCGDECELDRMGHDSTEKIPCQYIYHIGIIRMKFGLEVGDSRGGRGRRIRVLKDAKSSRRFNGRPRPGQQRIPLVSVTNGRTGKIRLPGINQDECIEFVAESLYGTVS
jgi:hypothetical protein